MKIGQAGSKIALCRRRKSIQINEYKTLTVRSAMKNSALFRSFPAPTGPHYQRQYVLAQNSHWLMSEPCR